MLTFPFALATSEISQPATERLFAFSVPEILLKVVAKNGEAACPESTRHY